MTLPREPAGARADVVIVGGGPAGSAAALWLARQGVRVVVLERERFPRHRPGETLPPGVEPIFAQLGVAEAIAATKFIRHRGTWVTWSGPRRFDAFGGNRDGPWLGFQAPARGSMPSCCRRPPRPARSCINPATPCTRCTRTDALPGSRRHRGQSGRRG